MRPSYHQALFDVTFDRLCEEIGVQGEQRYELRRQLKAEAEEYRSY